MTAFYAHEIAHALGFGTLWENPFLNEYLLGPWNQYGKGDLLDYWGDFVGEYTLETFSELAGEPLTYVPVEKEGGLGTADSHWDSDHEFFDFNKEFTREIMGGYADESTNYLSEITISSIKDLGYEIVEFGDSYTQLMSEIATGISQENDFANSIIAASAISDEDSKNMDLIL